MKRTLFALLFLSYAYFYQGGGWNQNSRFDLVRAITNDGALRIDPYEKNTGDKAVFDGHTYSDKAPGLALTAVPPVALARVVLNRSGGDAESYAGLALLSYLATLVAVGLVTALGGVALYQIARDWGATEGGALFAATAAGLSTPLWALATVFIGHALASACLVFAFAAVVRIGGGDGGDSDDLAGPAEADGHAAALRREMRLGLLAGLAAGWATVTEFPAAIPAAFIALLACAHASPRGRAHAVRVIGALTAGALLCAAVLMIYQFACFGSPFHIGYTSEAGDFQAMKQGLFGIGLPTLPRLGAILFGGYRGLFPLAPLLIVAPFGFAASISSATDFGAARGHRRWGAAAALAIGLYYILLNASYTYWEGGWLYGPRHLAPGLPFLCLGLAPLWSRVRTTGRAALAALWIWGVALSLVAVATTAQPPAQIPRPVPQLLWPAFRAGELALNTQTFASGSTDPSTWLSHSEPKAAWNLGMKMGLRGLPSLAPLAAGWVLCAIAFSVGRRRTSSPPR